MKKINVRKQDIRINADPQRVIMNFFFPGTQERAERVIERVLSLPAKKMESCLDAVTQEFSFRHRSVGNIFLENFARIQKIMDKNSENTELFIRLGEADQIARMLIGAYFSKEYSIEAAAIFNPSIVLLNDDSGPVKFVMSLRAAGEGHISSIEFRYGTINTSGQITLDEIPRYVNTGKITSGENENSYSVKFDDKTGITERVLFPHSPDESNGLEDARFVFHSSDKKYYATYTGYNGKKIQTKMIETEDFRSFRLFPVFGDAVKDKGMALFPEKINGRYVMISRQDGENLYIMESSRIDHWEKKKLLKVPSEYWEFVQIGNCGSPVRTEKGWLLLTHGVGAVRKYSISALLLDAENPEKIAGVLKEPLISPGKEEREGYVPNVVYTCGCAIVKNKLIIPYAMSDAAIAAASVDLKELLDRFEPAV